MRENEPNLEVVEAERNPSLNEMKAERENVDTWPMVYPEWIELRMKEHRRIYGRNHGAAGDSPEVDSREAGTPGKVR